MSLPVNPSVSVPSQPQAASLPQVQRIIQDVTECVRQLKEDFTSSSAPITDDSQVVQRFCVRLEYLLQYEMKERFTLLGKRKDYWDYFCDCLASNKGANDGIRYVKGLGENKTSLGRGRAFVRFSLVHQRLADTLQQCCIHPKTVEWYNPSSVWARPDVYSSIISTLYDLNSLHFDLPPRGYDLDSAWPTFARNMPPGAGNWTVPSSRRSSITSMDTLSLASTDPSEVSRLQQELVSAETARSALVENVASLEQERQRAEQSVWMTQGELTAMQEQLRSSAKKMDELQKKHSALELSHSQLQKEKAEQAKDVDRQAAELSAQQQQLSQEKQQLAQQVEKDRSQFASEVQTLRQNLIEATDARDKLTTKVTSLEEALEQMRAWDTKKDQQISRLEQQTDSLESKNKSLLEEMAKNVSTREEEAMLQMESAYKMDELLGKLRDVEEQNRQLEGQSEDLKQKCRHSESAAEEERARKDLVAAQLAAETQKCESLLSELQTLRTELDRERTSGAEAVKKLQTQSAQGQAENEKIKAELISTTETLGKTLSRQSDLSSYISQLMKVAVDSSGAVVDTPDSSSCSSSDVSQFVQKCQQLSRDRFSDLETRLEAAEKERARLAGERGTVQHTVDAIFNALPEKPEDSSRELTQQVQEVETRVKSLCMQVSDLSTNNSFLKEQLQLAQGEQTDKGNQLSHLEGRLLELEKALKESRATESSLQGQVASADLILKTAQQQNADLQSQLEATTSDVAARTQALQELEQAKTSLEKQVEDLEKQRTEQASSVEAALGELEEKKGKEEALKLKVEEMESELEASRKEVEEKRNQLSLMQEKVKEAEEKVESILDSMASLETDKVVEHDTFQQQLTQVTSQLTSTLAERDQQQADKELLQGEMARLEEEHVALQKELDLKASEVASLQESLQTRASTHADVEGELKRQLESLTHELSQAKDEASKTRDSLSEATSLKETAETERDATVQKLDKATMELQEKEVTFSEQLQNLRVQLGTFEKEKEELRKSSSSTYEELTNVLTEKQNVVSSLEQEKRDLEKQVKDSLEHRQTLEAETERLQAELAEGKKATETEKTKLLEEKRETQSKLQADIDSLKEQNSNLRKELEQVKTDLSTKLGEIKDTKLELETTRIETDRLRSDSASEKSELEDSLEKLQARFSELQTAMDAMLKEKEELTAQHAAAQEEITELKADLASSADGYNFLLQSSQKVQEEKDSEIETLKSQLEHATKELDAKLDATSSEKKSAEEKVVGLESACQALRSQEQELGRALAEKSREAAELRGLTISLSSSIAVLEEDDRARREEIAQLEEKLQEKEEECSSQVEALEQELSALQFQLSAEQLQHAESLRSMGDHETSATEMSSRLTDQEALIGDLEKELSSLQADFETERTNQNQQLEELKGLLKSKEHECRVLAEQLQKSSDKLAETLTSIEFYQKENNSLHITLDRDLEEREEEIRTLRSDNEQLKKKLVKMTKDKAALWQQTDELVYEHKRKSEGKWLDSSTVAKCMGCQSEFSLFLRKHHCRLCGRIFCFSCSDFWVDSTSSSRKARACVECYNSLQKLDASITKPSLLPDDSDDDVGNVGNGTAASGQSSQSDSQSLCSQPQRLSPEASTSADTENSPTSPVDFEEDVYASRTCDSPDLPKLTSTPLTSPDPATAASSDASATESASQDSAFQVITQEEVTKSIAAYDEGLTSGPQSFLDVPNMSSSMLLTAEELASGEINTQSETWIKPGRSFAVPISITHPNTVVTWEFTVNPKDIEFSITYLEDSGRPVSQAEVVVAPARCHSLKEPIHGELTAKQAGVYSLIFDNSYSRMTSKKIHYTLSYNS